MKYKHTAISDNRYSTTKLLTKKKPQLINKPDDKFKTILFLPEVDGRIGEGGLRTKGFFKTSHPGKPLVTIITVVYNGARYLEEAIKSVLNQNYDNIEYIIIDGASTDGSVDIIKKYEKYIDYWVSEKDSGIGNAWNKGLTLSKGDIVGILNSDDYYPADVLDNVVKKMKNDNIELIYGIAKFVNDENDIVRINNKIFDFNALYKGFGFMHTTCFLKSCVYKKIGLFDENVSIAVDCEFLLRCLKSNLKFHQNDNVTYMRLGGISDRREFKAHFEYMKLLKKFYYNGIQIFIYNFIYIIKYFLRKSLNQSIIDRVRLQLAFIVIKIFNTAYNIIPTFFLRNILLKLSGIEIGKGSAMHSNLKFFHLGKITIGNNSSINPGCYLDNRKNITIGSNVNIAHDTKIYTLGHDINDPQFIGKGDNVFIDDYVCIFANSIILPGVKIGEGAVVYPGSVVTKDVPPYSVVGGNPAKIISTRNRNLQYTINNKYWFAQ